MLNIPPILFFADAFTVIFIVMRSTGNCFKYYTTNVETIL